MKTLACAPKYSLFLIGVTEEEYQREIVPLMAILVAQHTQDDVRDYVSSKEEVAFDLKDNEERLKDPGDNYAFYLKDTYGIEPNEFTRFFLIDRSLTRCFSVPADYPGLREWEGKSPFYFLDQCEEFSSILGLEDAKMTWKGKPRKEGYKPLGSLEKEIALKKAEEEIADELHKGVDDATILAGIRRLYMDDQIDAADYEHLYRYMGRKTPESWFSSSWPDRKIVPIEALESVEQSDNYNQGAASAHIATGRKAGKSDPAIFLESVQRCIAGEIDYRSVELMASLLRMALPEDIKPEMSEKEIKKRLAAWIKGGR